HSQIAIALFKDYLPLGHPQVRATAYAVIAWYEWALGGSTMAENYALAAIELEPEHRLSQLITHAVVNGLVPRWLRSEEHTSELQSRFDLVCRLLLEKKKQRVHGTMDIGQLMTI